MKKIRSAILLVAVVIGGAALLSVLAGEPRSGVEIGERVPEYRARRLGGGEVALSDYRGDVVLINIWATWCGPCRVEMPSIQSAYERYRDEGFEVLAAAIDEGPRSREKVERFVAQHDLTFTVLLDPEGRITRRLRTAGVPETFVLDREGRIVKRHIGATDWDSAANRALLEELLRN